MKKSSLVFLVWGLLLLVLASPSWADWSRLDMGFGGDDMEMVTLGAGRNDGIMRIYAACCIGPIYEFSWNGSSYDKVLVGYGGRPIGSTWYAGYMYGVAVGKGHWYGKSGHLAIIKPLNDA